MTGPHSGRIVRDALALRATHPWAPALDLLVLVMQGHEGTRLDFDTAAVPPARFALIVAEAFDTAMSPLEWLAFTHADADPLFRAGVLQVWASQVWPRFLSQYDIGSP